MNPGKVAEGGANVLPGQAVGKRENVSPGTALEVRCATGTTADRFMQVNEHAAELVAAAEGDAWVGESTAEWMHTLTSVSRSSPLD